MSIIKKNQGGYLSIRPFFNEFFNDRGSLERLFDGEEFPAVNIVEGEKNYEIEVAAPGMKKDDFKIEIANSVLTISRSVSRLPPAACQLASPPQTGVPVPGAKAGSSASMSKVR